jgi:hypothetical protein
MATSFVDVVISIKRRFSWEVPIQAGLRITQ